MKAKKDIEYNLFDELSQLIEQSQQEVVTQANSTLTLLFWHAGNRLIQNILQNKRAEYSKQIVSTLSTQLENAYGRNFTEKNVMRMIQFAKQFDDFAIVVTLSRQMSWSHFLVLIPVRNIEAKEFYAQKAIAETLGVRDLRKKIAAKIFDRTHISNFQVTAQAPALHNAFKDPYFLDFLGLKNTYLEKDLEQAILRALKAFILELGKGFAFVERQKRMIIDGEDFHLDLLF